jgi:hypothetical protein
LGNRGIEESKDRGIEESGRSLESQDREIGLCATCAHVSVIVSDRGSTFYACQRAKTDPRFPRYPRLPVVACFGYDEKLCTPSSPRG